MIYADQRWIGDHGIGRFARHVLTGLDYDPVPLGGHPAAPLDSWRLARALRKLTTGDLFYSPGYNSPLYCSSPFVFTIHDLSHIHSPENSSFLIRLYYATVLKRACHRAACVLTVSEFTRRQILDWSGEPSEKVVNVGCGVDSAYQPEGPPYGLTFPYLLCVSNRKRHKNEFRVLEAFAKAQLSMDVHLVFTGGNTTDIATRISRLGIAARVDFLGVVPEDKMPGLYRGATALVFPSLYEGFGLPVLEAMACGAPVVTSNVTAMPEVAGGAALLVDPTSVSQIANAMERIVTENALRERLRESGLRRAAQFSWGGTVVAVENALQTAARQLVRTA